MRNSRSWHFFCLISCVPKNYLGFFFWEITFMKECLLFARRQYAVYLILVSERSVYANVCSCSKKCHDKIILESDHMMWYDVYNDIKLLMRFCMYIFFLFRNWDGPVPICPRTNRYVLWGCGWMFSFPVECSNAKANLWKKTSDWYGRYQLYVMDCLNHGITRRWEGGDGIRWNFHSADISSGCRGFFNVFRALFGFW
jgi:hypothetical protein